MLYLGPFWVSHRNLLWKLSLEEKKNKKKPLKVGRKLMKIMASASSYNNFLREKPFTNPISSLKEI